jgi:hypothetical protein
VGAPERSVGSTRDIRASVIRLWLVIGWLWCGVANAQGNDPVKQAEEFFSAGNVAYLKGDYAGAVRAFEEAFRLAPHPALAFSLAQALRRQFFADSDPKKLRRAVELLRFYLEHDPSGRRRSDAVDLLERLEPRLALLEAARTATVTRSIGSERGRDTMLTVSTEAPDATVSIDGKEAKGVPVFQPVEPGAHQVVVTAPGHRTATRTVQVAEGQNLGLDIPLEEIPAQVRVNADGGEAVTIDGRLIGKAPFRDPILLQAGLHSIEITRSGRLPVIERATLAPGQELALTPDLSMTAARKASYWTFGGSAVLGVVGLSTLIAAIRYEDRAQTIFEDGLSMGLTEEMRVEYEDSAARRDDLRIATVSVLVTAGVGAIAGAILYLLDER